MSILYLRLLGDCIKRERGRWDMYECELHTKFRPEEMKRVSFHLGYGAALLGVKAEKNSY